MGGLLTACKCRWVDDVLFIVSAASPSCLTSRLRFFRNLVISMAACPIVHMIENSLPRNAAPMPQPPSDARKGSSLLYGSWSSFRHIECGVLCRKNNEAVTSLSLFSDPGLQAAQEDFKQFVIADVCGHVADRSEVKDKEGKVGWRGVVLKGGI